MRNANISVCVLLSCFLFWGCFAPKNDKQVPLDNDEEQQTKTRAYTQQQANEPADFRIADNGKNSVMIAGYEGKSRMVVIPDTIDGKNVTAIGIRAFQWNQLTSVTIPNSVTTIGQEAFRANQLISVIIPDSVITIGKMAFSNNRGLMEIRCETGNPAYTSVDGVLFTKDRKTLVAYPGGKEKVYTIPNGVTTIGENAFFNNQQISITMPNSVTTIGDFAFANNNQLTNVIISNSVTTIGEFAFAYNQLTSVAIGTNVTFSEDVFDDGFDKAYAANGKRSGQYTKNNDNWTYTGSR